MVNSKKVKKAVVTAAGWGRRILPASKDIPKEMLPIVDMPAIFYVVEECLEAGIKDIAVVVREDDLVVKRFFSYGGHLEDYLAEYGNEDVLERYLRVINELNLTFLKQSRDMPYGNGVPILVAKEWLNGDTFVYCLGDDVFLNPSGDGAVKQIVEYYEKVDSNVSGILRMVNMPREKVVDYVWYALAGGGDNGRVVEIIEKPDIHDVKDDVSGIGRMIYTSDVFDYFFVDKLGKHNELWSTDAVQLAIKDGKRFNAKLIRGKQLTVGTAIGQIETNVRYGLERGDIKEDLRKLLKDIVG